MKSFVLAAILFFEIPALFAQPDTVWTRTYGGDSTDVAYAVRQTSDGGFAFTGYTRSFGNGSDDFWLVKTDEDGDSLWSRTYGGSESDRCNSLILTEDNGFLLVGSTESFGSGSSDVWVVRVDEDGDSLWSRTLGGSEQDEGADAVESSNGDLYIAGTTYSFGAPGADFWLIALNHAGDSLWSQTYGEYPPYTCEAIAAFTDGRLVLAGTHHGGNGASFRAYTVSADGELLDGFGDSWLGYSFGSDVAVLSNQNYAIAGQYYDEDDIDGVGKVVLVSGIDYSGIWRRDLGGSGYDAFTAVQGDHDDRIICAGFTESYDAEVNYPDFWLAQLGPDGDSLWMCTFDHGGSELAFDVQTLATGYILVGTCGSWPPGSDVWLVRAGYTDAVLDAYPTGLEFGHVSAGDTVEQLVMLRNPGNDDILVTGLSMPNSFSSNLESAMTLAPGDSTELRLRFHPDAIGPFAGVATVLGNMENVVTIEVVGYGLVDSLWSHTYGGPAADSCCAVISLSDGGFLLAGSTYSFGAGGVDYYVVRTDDAGEVLWSRTYGRGEDDICRAAVLLLNDEIALAGASESFNTYKESWFWLVKIDAAGDTIWSRTYDLGSEGVCTSMSLTLDGGFLLGGYTVSGEHADFAVLKTDSHGDSSWSLILGNADSDERCNAVYQLSDGTTIAVGSKEAPLDDDRATGYVVGIDSVGNFLNQRIYNYGYGDDGFNHISVMQDGNFILTGTCEHNWYPSNGSDMWTVVAIPFGGWWQRLNTVELHNHAWMSCLLPEHGLLTVGSTGTSFNGMTDGLVVAYDLDGPTDWIRTYGGEGSDEIRTAVLTDSGVIMLGGNTNSSGGGESDFWLIKLGWMTPPDQSDDASRPPLTFGLGQNYPNPFNSATRISFDLPREAHATVKVFNVMGQEVVVLADEFMNSGTHSIMFNADELPSGIYFCNLRTATQSETRKMVLLK